MVFNTFILYARVGITVFVTLFSSRWILQALGKEDFGIFNLVSGLLTMLTFLNVTMASSSQRFLSYALGKGDQDKLKEMFYFSTVLHFGVGILIVLLIETVGRYLLMNVLLIPEGKYSLALFVLHCLSVSTFTTVISVPYSASLITHENIFFVALIQITEALLKLGAAVLLLYYDGPRLKLYSVCMMMIPIVSACCYRTYCYRKYIESHIILHRITDYALFREFASYSGWNLIGGLSSMLRTQGVAMLMNSFYGVIVNAAYGIATQVNGQMNFFSASIVTSTRPQIVKSEGMGNRARMHALSATTSKITFLLLAMLSIPILVEMPYILHIWLRNVPDYTINFTRLILLQSLVFQFSVGVSIGVESVGKIKLLQLYVGILHFIVIPIGYICLKLGLSPYAVLICVIIEELIGFVLRLFVSRKVTGLNISEFLKNNTIPCIISAIFTALICFGIKHSLVESLIRLLLIILSSLTIICILSYYFVLNNNEISTIISIIKKVRRKK